MAYSRAFVLLTLMLALAVSLVEANGPTPPAFQFCGKCLIQGSRIETIALRAEFKIRARSDDFVDRLGPFCAVFGTYDVRFGPYGPDNRCKVACRYVSPTRSLSHVADIQVTLASLR